MKIIRPEIMCQSARPAPDAVDASGIISFNGVQASRYASRFYEPNLAPNAVGYTLFISQEELNTYRRLGYSGAERIGWEGIEKWGESYLHGRNAATLYVTAADGTYETVLAQVDSEPASSITLTIDMDLQEQAQAAMDGLPGAIVVMEVNTGRVLAMVSSPGFDPNWYDLNNVNRQFTDEQPTFNRAAQGTYPLGSVFKIITMAAALESGVFTPDTTYECGYAFTDIPGHTLYDWTWDRCQSEKQHSGKDTCTGANAQPSGLLTLKQGLMRSCDPWFYHIGYEPMECWQRQSHFRYGQVLWPGEWHRDRAGGRIEREHPQPRRRPAGHQHRHRPERRAGLRLSRWRPLSRPSATAERSTARSWWKRSSRSTGDAISVFHPQANGTLPLTTANLKAIQDAMRSVVQDPRGTAYSRFVGFPFPVAAKTGTAESGATDPHAWFAGLQPGRPAR